MMYEQLIFKKYLYLNNNNKLGVKKCKILINISRCKGHMLHQILRKKIFTLMPLAPNL